MKLPEDFYARVHESMPILCVDVVVTNGESVLLIRRGREPEKGTWWFPGGRLLRDEKLKYGVTRVVKDETGLAVFNPTFLTVAETLFDEDPFGHGKGTHTVNMVYLARARETAIFSVMLDDNHDDHRWVPIKDVFSGDYNDYVKRHVALASGMV